MLKRPLRRTRDQQVSIFDRKNINFFSCIFFFQFLVITTLDPDPDSLEIMDPDPASLIPDSQR